MFVLLCFITWFSLYFVKGVQKMLLQGCSVKLKEITRFFSFWNKLLIHCAWNSLCLWHTSWGSKSPHLVCWMIMVLQLWNSHLTLTLERPYTEQLTGTLLQEHKAVDTQMWTLLFSVHWEHYVSRKLIISVSLSLHSVGVANTYQKISQILRSCSTRKRFKQYFFLVSVLLDPLYLH